MNILSLQKDVAYVMDQLGRAMRARTPSIKNDCIQRAMDGMERVHEQIKDIREPSNEYVSFGDGPGGLSGTE